MEEAKFKPRAQLLQLNIWVGIKVKVKFTLEQATKTQRGSRGIDLLILNLGTRWGGVVTTPRLLYPLG
jgi:hypothetical protein